MFTRKIFPYIREKVSSLTDDSRERFILPIIDLRNIRLSEGIKYTWIKKQ